MLSAHTLDDGWRRKSINFSQWQQIREQAGTIRKSFVCAISNLLCNKYLENNFSHVSKKQIFRFKNCVRVNNFFFARGKFFTGIFSCKKRRRKCVTSLLLLFLLWRCLRKIFFHPTTKCDTQRVCSICSLSQLRAISLKVPRRDGRACN